MPLRATLPIVEDAIWDDMITKAKHSWYPQKYKGNLSVRIIDLGQELIVMWHHLNGMVLGAGGTQHGFYTKV